MTYYRVKPEFDNFNLWHNGKYAGILVANELYTEEELNKKHVLFCYGVKFDMFEMVQIPQSKIHWIGESRYESEKPQNPWFDDFASNFVRHNNRGG